MVLDLAGQIVAKSVDMEFLHPVQRVVDEKLTHILIEVSENKTAGDALIGKVEAVVVIIACLIRVGQQIEEVQAMPITIEGTGMIVNHVEEHRDSVNVKNVDHYFQLRHGTGEVRLR